MTSLILLLMLPKRLFDPLQFEWLWCAAGLLEAEILSFLVAHQGYLPPQVGSQSLKQVDQGDRAIVISNTATVSAQGN